LSIWWFTQCDNLV